MLFIPFLFIHGLIHFLGFYAALRPQRFASKGIVIPLWKGVLWLIPGMLFIVASAYLFAFDRRWYYFMPPAIVLSQLLIFLNWKAAKFGTFINLYLAWSTIVTMGISHFQSTFHQDAEVQLKPLRGRKEVLITEADLEHLPPLVRNYLHYCKVVGKARVYSMATHFNVRLREKGKDFFDVYTRQYNFFEEPTRLFYLEGSMKHMSVVGYHRYKDGKASMRILAEGIIPIVEKSGNVLDTTETVTYFNDMCLLAPATLIDPRIQWEPIDAHSVRGIFTNRGIRISAILQFREDGALANFISNDRTEINSMQKLEFSTPVLSYDTTGNRWFVNKAVAIWKYPDGPFTYGEFSIASMGYNAWY